MNYIRKLAYTNRESGLGLLEDAVVQGGVSESDLS